MIDCFVEMKLNHHAVDPFSDTSLTLQKQHPLPKPLWLKADLMSKPQVNFADFSNMQNIVQQMSLVKTINIDLGEEAFLEYFR